MLFGGQDGGVVGMLDSVPAVGVQDRGADFQQRGVGGCWGRGRAPDYAVEDGRGHEGAVEEGCVGHCILEEMGRKCACWGGSF